MSKPIDPRLRRFNFGDRTYMDLDIRIADLARRCRDRRRVNAFMSTHGHLLEPELLVRSGILMQLRLAAVVNTYIRYYCRVPSCECAECRDLPPEGAFREEHEGHTAIRVFGPCALGAELRRLLPDTLPTSTLLDALYRLGRMEQVVPYHALWFRDMWSQLFESGEPIGSSLLLLERRWPRGRR